MSAKVVLIGPMASGKSKIGRRVASRLGALRIDTDKVFVAEHGDITKFFARYGEEAFRDREEEIVADALGTDAVVSLGGGAVLRPRTQAALRDEHVVYLTVSSAAVGPRLLLGKRPLVADEGVSAWNRIFEERRPIYESLARRTYDTSRGNLDEIAADIVDWINSGYTSEKKSGLR